VARDGRDFGHSPQQQGMAIWVCLGLTPREAEERKNATIETTNGKEGNVTLVIDLKYTHRHSHAPILFGNL